MFKRRFALFLALSLCFHLLLVAMGFYAPQKSAENHQAIEVTVISKNEVKKTKTQTVEDKLKRQIVQQDIKPNQQEAPKDAKYLSAANQKVEKETVADRIGSFHNAKSLALGKEEPQHPKITQSLTPPAKAAKASQERSRNINLAEVYKTYDSGLLSANNRKELTKQESAEPPVGSMNPSQTDDYLKDTEKGVETLVNAREFKYFSYYSRIRRQLSQYWEPLVKEKFKKIYRTGRAPAAESKDRITRLMIVLNSAGNLVKIQVLADSGIMDLDDAAIEAFKMAAPFPNPPNGIVEGDGMVRIRWDFILET